MLQIVKTILLVAMGICVLWLTGKLLKGKSTKKVILWSCVSGIVSLLILSIVGEKIVPTLPINPYTLGSAAVLGIPGVILLTLTKIIWQL